MVYYKRKPFDYIVPPAFVPPDTQCWLIPETGEIFPAYESYLERLSFYNMRKFTDSISGETNLSFWEALEKEKQGSQDIDADFPDALREPILRKCQFSQKSRLTDLVTSLYHEFNDNIVAGEQVQFQDAETGSKATGQLKERTVFFDRPDLTRYFVQVPGESGPKPNIACVDRHHIWRKPRSFTKFNLQRFLRHTIHRERYDGAPWLVKEQYALQYRLDTEIPYHLTQEAMAAERRLKNGIRRNYFSDLPEAFEMLNNRVMPRPDASPSQSDVQYVHDKFDGVKYNGEQVLQMRPAPQQRPPNKQVPEPRPPPPPAPPPIKYPIADLELKPKKDAPKRPSPHDFTKFQLFPTYEGLEGREPVEMASMGPLLETWNTLTVFGEFFCLDGFVWDDFVGAMFVTSETIYCELFYEVHCAVLVKLVDESGKILSDTIAKTNLSAKDNQSSTSTSASISDDEEEQNDPDVEMQDVVVNGSAQPQHKASDMVTQGDWVEMLQNRQFAYGAWTLIIVGILNRLSSRARFKDRCERILAHLAPVDKQAIAPTAFQQYMSMDINLRIQALELMTILVTETKPFKEHIESLVSQSTDTRKEKTSLQSQAKPLRIELSKLEQQEKLLRPDTMDTQKEQKTDTEVNRDTHTPPDEEVANEHEDDMSSRASDESESEGDDDMPRSSRRISSRAADLKKRQRKLEEQKQNKEETKELAEYRKVLKEFEKKNAEKEKLEEEIQQYEQELRENSCYRTKLMGRDRFLNRYIWFERNGMPFEGESESTEYGYANGRLWVQGPDAIERPGILDLNKTEEKEYQAKFKMTIPERRDLQEGPVQLASANQWAYYDDPKDVDLLISWLDAKGEREKQLKKELSAWRKPLQTCMSTMREHLDEVAEEHARLEDRPVGIATRKKINADLDRTRYPCLHWENTFFRGKFSQCISDGPPPKRTKKSRNKDREASAQPERRTTRQGGRSNGR